MVQRCVFCLDAVIVHLLPLGSNKLDVRVTDANVGLHSRYCDRRSKKEVRDTLLEHPQPRKEIAIDEKVKTGSLLRLLREFIETECRQHDLAIVLIGGVKR